MACSTIALIVVIAVAAIALIAALRSRARYKRFHDRSVVTDDIVDHVRAERGLTLW